jgi:membrane-bound lytic murein transglycosylase D
MVTPPDASFDLHLPGGMAAVFEQRIAAIPEGKRNAWRYHRVAAEDTLASVARAYRVTDAELAAANQLHARDSIEGLEALLVPTPPAAEPAHARLYTVRKGDTLVTIADRFGVSLNELRRWNKIPGIKVQPGQRLHVAEPVSVKRAAVRTHRSGGSPAGAHGAQAAPAKNAPVKPASAPAPIKSATPAAKKVPAQRSATAAGAKKNGATGAKKSRARRRTVTSKTPAAK